MQGVKVVDVCNLTSDKKLDDKYITAEFQVIDEEEPPRNICDTFASVEKVVKKLPPTILKLDRDDTQTSANALVRRKTSKASEFIKNSMNVQNKKSSTTDLNGSLGKNTTTYLGAMDRDKDGKL